MKIKFHTAKIARFSEYFSIFITNNDESDLTIAIVLFGRDFSWSFYKKDSSWINY